MEEGWEGGHAHFVLGRARRHSPWESCCESVLSANECTNVSVKEASEVVLSMAVFLGADLDLKHARSATSDSGKA